MRSVKIIDRELDRFGERTFRRRIGKLFVASPRVSEYKSVIMFPNNKVVMSGEVARSEKNCRAEWSGLSDRSGPNQGSARICDRGQLRWTDESYRNIRVR
jgi:hypothetical protein